MKKLSNGLPVGVSAEDAVFLALAEKKIHLTEALDMFANLGQILQGIPHEQREGAITSLGNEIRKLTEQRDLPKAMMLIHFMQTWQQS